MGLAWLLLGPGNLRHNRLGLFFLGSVLLLCGILIFVDASDTVTQLTLEAFGWVLVAIGLFKLAFSVIGAGGGMSALLGFQGIVYIVLGYAIADFSENAGNAVPWLFGSAFLINGAYQIVSALIIRFPLWGWFVISGVIHLGLGAFMFLEWKQAVEWVIPLMLGFGFAVLGILTLLTAFRMGRYLTDGGWDAGKALQFYLDFHVPTRFRKGYFTFSGVEEAEPPKEHHDLLVHIWTPTTVAGVPDRHTLMSSYIVARDPEGKFTVGHSALELPPDVYISHCDGDPTAFDSSEEVWQELRSKDVSGVFLPSFEEEVKTYMDPSVTVRFRRFNAEQLRAFWASYRVNPAYNLTNRNCSVAVALALECSLMGSMSRHRSLQGLLRLLSEKDLWVAWFIRWKAREMVWTPGLTLDYTLALHRLVES
jgi:uncharacterized membrane protein HdeD (DUF308 family)